MFKIIYKSLMNRWFTALLTVLSIGLSVSLLLAVENMRKGTKEGFTQTIASTDLIVGAKGSPLNLLLYTIFHMGSPTENISWESYQTFANGKDIDWTIPLAMGDSHKSFRVIGTDNNLFEHYKFGRQQSLTMKSGSFDLSTQKVVLGSTVAKTLGYKVGDEIIIAHGTGGGVSFHYHDDKPFSVSGMMAPTGTPLDKSLFISLESMTALHADDDHDHDHGGHADASENEHDHEGHDHGDEHEGHEQEGQDHGDEHEGHDHEGHDHGDEHEGHDHEGHEHDDHSAHEDMEKPELAAFLLKTKSRVGALPLQREINDFEDEPLSAGIPGIILSDLWKGLSYVESTLTGISVLVIVIGLLGMLITLYNSLNERKREIAIFRSIGASPLYIFTLLISEAGILSLMGAVTGLLLSNGVSILVADYLRENFSVYLSLGVSITDLAIVGLTVCLGLLLGAIPAMRAYRQTLQDGLTIKI
ncbi:MAG: ABC transporter permease [Pseudobacteriovorax sp.]|nr:ABC transporter permease [Pseudobacteriovorax sp.]